MACVLYMRVSTKEQSIDSQREAFKNKSFDKEYIDHGVSGSKKALDREAFSKCFDYVREGDLLVVYAIDRLGRNGRDVVDTVNLLRDKGVDIEVYSLGLTIRKNDSGISNMILAIMASMAEMERERILERQRFGIQAAKEKGVKFGAKRRANYDDVIQYRANHTVKQTALFFGIAESSVKRIQARVKSGK